MNNGLTLSTGGAKHSNARDNQFRTIIVPVDLSKHSEETATYAVGLAKALGASITFAHVYPPEVISEFSTEATYEIHDRNCEEAKVNLKSFGERFSAPDLYCDTAFRVGETAEEISSIARDLQADLIVTGSHHPGFLARLLGLESSIRILHSAPCPVVVYRKRK